MRDDNLDGCRLRLHHRWLTAWEDGKDVPPLYVEVSPTGRCNHRCSFCSMRALKYPDAQLPVERTIHVFQEMRDVGVRAVMFGGEGEPCLHTDFGTLANAAQWMGLYPALTTNAVRFDQVLQKQCLDDFVWIKASINAGRMTTYGKVHHCASTDWFAAWSNLENAVMRRKPAPMCRPEIGSQMVLLPQNAGEVEDHVARAQRAGLDHCVIKPMTSTLGATVYAKVTTSLPENIDSIVRKYSGAAFRVDVRANAFGALAQGRTYSTCRAVPNAWAYIDCHGDLWACSCHMLDRRFRMGNVLRRPFADVWYGPSRARLKALMLSWDVRQCRGACRMDRVNETLDRIGVRGRKDGHL